MIKNNPDKPWKWSSMSKNPNITWEIIRDNPDKPWDWYYISMNSNITMDIIRDNPDKPWKWSSISMNTFTKEKEEFINIKYREYMDAYNSH